MKLEKVIGYSCKGQNSIVTNPRTGDLIYIAGNFLVVYSSEEKKQSKFLRSRTNRPFQCVTISADGSFLAAGENAYKSPEIAIWKIDYSETSKIKYVEIKHLRGHRYGIECLKFAPNNKFLIAL